MKKEYFIQVRKFDDEDDSVIDKLDDWLGDRGKVFRQPGRIARSAGAGMSLDKLDLSPVYQQSCVRDIMETWYMAQITGLVEETPYTDLDDLEEKLVSKLESTIGKITTGYVFRVTATDTSPGFDIIRYGWM